MRSIEVLRILGWEGYEKLWSVIISQFKISIVILNEVRNLAGCKAFDRLQGLEILRYTQDDKQNKETNFTKY